MFFDYCWLILVLTLHPPTHTWSVLEQETVQGSVCRFCADCISVLFYLFIFALRQCLVCGWNEMQCFFKWMSDFGVTLFPLAVDTWVILGDGSLLPERGFLFVSNFTQRCIGPWLGILTVKGEVGRGGERDNSSFWNEDFSKGKEML